jgi:hypothetical protein
VAEGETGLKIRVVASFALILVGKVINVILPIVYKWVVDALSTDRARPIVVPVALVIGYGWCGLHPPPRPKSAT